MTRPTDLRSHARRLLGVMSVVAILTLLMVLRPAPTESELLPDRPVARTAASRVRVWDADHGGYGHAVATAVLPTAEVLRYQLVATSEGVARLDRVSGEVCVYTSATAADDSGYLEPLCARPTVP
jgi:hypothetical protein